MATESQVTDVHIGTEVQCDIASEVKLEVPLSDTDLDRVLAHRRTIGRILRGEDPRMLVVVGPCSLHSEEGALEFGRRLAALSSRFSDQLYVVMRACGEKPRTQATRSAWPGMILDPFLGLDGFRDFNIGIRLYRRIARSLVEMGIPVAAETVYPSLTMQYIDDVLAMAWVGARNVLTMNSRQSASGLSMPVGFKNLTDGSVQAAIDGVVSAREPNDHFGPDQETGRMAIFHSTGNPDAFVILRGGERDGKAVPNHGAEHVRALRKTLRERELLDFVMVDCSHKNCEGNYLRQVQVFENIVDQRIAGDRLVGAMLEASMAEGKQSIIAGQWPHPLTSVTDACVSWATTEDLLLRAAERLREHSRLRHASVAERPPARATGWAAPS